MMFQRRRASRSRGRTDFRLEEERSRVRATGFGMDGYIRVKDETGNVWSGLAEDEPGDVVRFHLTDSHGRRVTGIASGATMLFRDDLGRTWKGFVE